jgi:hypothetical protein
MSVGSVIDLADDDGEVDDPEFSTSVGLTCRIGGMVNLTT